MKAIAKKDRDWGARLREERERVGMTGFSKLCVEKQNSVSTKSALHVAWRWNSVSTAVKRVTPDFAKTTDQSPQCWRESGTFRAVI